jgi:hypothetical protein
MSRCTHATSLSYANSIKMYHEGHECNRVLARKIEILYNVQDGNEFRTLENAREQEQLSWKAIVA